MTTTAPAARGAMRRGRAARLAVRLAAFFALERNIVRVSGTMFLMGLGENLWRRFLPKYLEALGAPITAVGAFGSLQDLLDGAYQYPGGWVADRFGRRNALLLFTALAAVGYAIFLVAPSWPWVFAGLAFVMAWSSMASPTLFAVVGDALPKGSRAMGFTVQAILKRVPILVAPVLGGVLIAGQGVRGGVQIGLGISIALALATLIVAARVRLALPGAGRAADVRAVWRALPANLRRLLASDILIRTCEGLVDVFLVIWAVNVIGISATQFGVLIGIQTATSIAVYLPVARHADRGGRKAFVTLTFLAFALFPLAVVMSTSFATLCIAFVMGGLRELGEPARKALIVDLAEPALRARSVGLYYLIRSLAITPAAALGGVLWQFRPALPFLLACAVGLAGTVVFARTVRGEAGSGS